MCENKVLYLKGNCNFYVKYFVVDNIICFYRFMFVCIFKKFKIMVLYFGYICK